MGRDHSPLRWDRALVGVWVAVPQNPTSREVGSAFILRSWAQISNLALGSECSEPQGERAGPFVCVHRCWGSRGVCGDRRFPGHHPPTPWCPALRPGHELVKGSTCLGLCHVCSPFPDAARHSAGAQSRFTAQRMDIRFSPARAQHRPGLNTRTSGRQDWVTGQGGCPGGEAGPWRCLLLL